MPGERFPDTAMGGASKPGQKEKCCGGGMKDVTLGPIKVMDAYVCR